jgi:hypothetical protein
MYCAGLNRNNGAIPFYNLPRNAILAKSGLAKQINVNALSMPAVKSQSRTSGQIETRSYRINRKQLFHQ